MEREIIRVEPFDTNFEKWGAPVSVCTRAGDTIYVSGMPPFDPETGEVLDNAPFERQADRALGHRDRLPRGPEELTARPRPAAARPDARAAVARRNRGTGGSSPAARP